MLRPGKHPWLAVAAARHKTPMPVCAGWSKLSTSSCVPIYCPAITATWWEEQTMAGPRFPSGGVERPRKSARGPSAARDGSDSGGGSRTLLVEDSGGSTKAKAASSQRRMGFRRYGRWDTGPVARGRAAMCRQCTTGQACTAPT